MNTLENTGTEELGAEALEATLGGEETSLLGKAVGYVVGYCAGLIVTADPFDGNYYGVGA